ncbi:hybrid sensor histidine kinase/response regulator [Oxalobacteraceae bacterium OM1]|nr:hybrid sensor histidine kinase/response regulator [Oxalobacteraceae bacterium OM1]
MQDGGGAVTSSCCSLAGSEAAQARCSSSRYTPTIPVGHEVHVRIRTRLLLLVLSVLLPSFAAAALAVWYVYSEERAAQEESLKEAARSFALLVDNELQTSEATLQALAESPSLARGNLPEFYAHARSLVRPPERTIVLQTTDGRQVLNTRVPFGTPLPQQRSSNIEALMRVHGMDRTLISDVFYAPIARRYDFVIQVPVRRDGELRYFLTMGSHALTLNRLWQAQRFPAGWRGTIVDRNGVVVARTDEAERFVGKPLRDYSRNILRANAEGQYESVTLEGIPVTAFFSRVPGADWTVLISIPLAELRKVPTRAALLLGAMMVGLLVLATLLARHLGARAIRPIEELRRAAAGLGSGEEVNYRPAGLVEVDAVGLALAGASRDIRESQRVLEERVSAAVAEAERAGRALQQAQKLEALGRLTGGIAHEFNNLLQTMSTALELVAMTADARVRSLVATCRKAIERATTLTGQLKSFGRVQEGTLATVAVDRQVEAALELLHGALPSNIALEVELAPGLWPVKVDALQFDLALLNVALNARDAMPSGGRLSLKVSNLHLEHSAQDLPAGDYVQIAVADSGSGMSPEVLARALDPFFTTKGVGKGTGLGLPQAYGFARQSGGLLLLHSEEGQGTRVEILLPRAHETPHPETPRSESSVHMPASHGRVLLVEDDALVREAVVPALQAAGFVVRVAENGEQALAMLRADSAVDAVFSDIVMPGAVSGQALAAAVLRQFPGIRVVLTTGYADQSVLLPGVQLLAKPYAIEQVIAALATPVPAPAG